VWRGEREIREGGENVGLRAGGGGGREKESGGGG